MDQTELSPEASTKPFGWKQAAVVLAGTIVAGGVALAAIKFVPEYFWKESDFRTGNTRSEAVAAYAAAVNQTRTAVGVTFAATLAFAAALMTSTVAARNIRANSELQAKKIDHSQSQQQASIAAAQEQQNLALESAQKQQTAILRQQAEENADVRFAELSQLLESEKETARLGALRGLARIASRDIGRLQDVVDVLSGHLRHTAELTQFSSQVISTICEILPDRPRPQDQQNQATRTIELNLDMATIPLLQVQGKKLKLSARGADIDGGIRLLDCEIEDDLDIRELHASSVMILDGSLLRGSLDAKYATITSKIEIIDSFVEMGIDMLSGRNPSATRLLITNSSIRGTFRSPARIINFSIKGSKIHEHVDLSKCRIEAYAVLLSTDFESGLNLDQSALTSPAVRRIETSASNFNSNLILPLAPNRWESENKINFYGEKESYIVRR